MNTAYQLSRPSFIKNHPYFHFSGELILVCRNIMNGLNFIANKNKPVAKKHENIKPAPQVIPTPADAHNGRRRQA